jgi:hypothetical protein
MKTEIKYAERPLTKFPCVGLLVADINENNLTSDLVVLFTGVDSSDKSGIGFVISAHKDDYSIGHLSDVWCIRDFDTETRITVELGN